MVIADRGGPGLTRRAAAAWVLAAVLALVAGCAPPPETSPAELVAEAETYDGHEVTVGGAVVAFDVDDGATHPHVVLEDRDANRIELLPTEVAEPYTGSAVEVHGIFEFSPDEGRRIHVEEIVEVGAGSSVDRPPLVRCAGPRAV